MQPPHLLPAQQAFPGAAFANFDPTRLLLMARGSTVPVPGYLSQTSAATAGWEVGSG